MARPSATCRVPTRSPQSPGRRTGPQESSASWRLSDRIGLAFAWFLGLLFCAICASIVVFLMIQGLRYLHPDLLWTNPKVGTTQNETGGFLADLIGTFLVAIKPDASAPGGWYIDSAYPE